MQPESLASSSASFTPLPLFTEIEAQQAVSILFTLLFILWALYTLITAYHWLRYGHRSSVAIPALITHVVVSGLLAAYAVSGLAA